MLRISVKPEHIINAESTTSRCPIAASILNQIDSTDFVLVNQNVIVIGTWIKGVYKILRYKTPRKMKHFISAFDSGKLVKPTTFYLWDWFHKLRNFVTTMPHF